MAVETFCFCGSLRSGAITAAVLNALAVIVFFTVGFISLSQYGYYNSRDLDKEATDRLYEGVKTIVQAIIGTVVLAYLCAGIHKEKATYLLPWLCFSAFAIFIWIIIFIVLAIGAGFASSIGKLEDKWIYILIIGIVFLCIILFMIHLVLVVVAYYRFLRAQQEQATSPIPFTGPPGTLANPMPVYYAPLDSKNPPPVPQVTSGSLYPRQQYVQAGEITNV